MSKNRLIKATYLICFSTIFLLIVSLHYGVGGKKLRKNISIFEETPDFLRNVMEDEFPDCSIESQDDYHLQDFLNGNSKTLIYDIEASSLIIEGNNFYFYPLYSDIIAIGIDSNYNGDSIESYEDLLDLGESINLDKNEPRLKYILSSIAYGLNERIDIDLAIGYLEDLGKENNLLLNKNRGNIRIDFASVLREDDYRVIVPKEGGLSFNVGLLSYDPIDETIVNRLRDSAKEIDYLYSNNISENTKELALASDFKDEFMNLKNYRPSFRRRILKEKLFGPADSEEHHIVSLVVIGLIILWIVQVERRVIHPGIKRGLFLMGILLIGLNILGIFKYSISGYVILAHILWYLYYVFLLPLPVISLYIAENADRIEKENLSLGIKISINLLIFFIILVLTNNYHQLIFKFLTDDFSKMGSEYSYGLAFILLSIWYGTSQVFAFVLMTKKGLDSPGRTKIIFPLIVMIIYLVYVLMYNMRISLAHDLPIVLGVSVLNIVYWSSAVMTDLIPSNRAYYNLFKASSLKIQIIDRDGQVNYKTAKSNSISDEIIGYFMSGDSSAGSLVLGNNELLWASSISGGKVITQENIEEINNLKDALEEATKELEKENLILVKKEQVEKRLILINEQSDLTREVHQGIKDKLEEIKELIVEMRNNPSEKMGKIHQIQMIAVYCKRKSELLIKSKNKKKLDNQELSRITHEFAEITSIDYHSFCNLNEPISFSEALEIYEYFHIMVEALYKNLVKETAIRIYRDGDIIIINTLFQGENEDIYRKIGLMIQDKGSIKLKKKDLGDTTSISIEIQGDSNYDRII